jgi:colanic acid biosynthesis glycosyl transferase WcaI
MRILLLTQWFDPEPTFKGLQFAKALLAAGHEVEVVTGFPNYPGGKVYPGYSIYPWQRETMEGVRVTRVWLFPSHDQSGFKRLLNYGSFCLSSMLAGLFLVRRPDVIYAYHPPLSTPVSAAVISILRRRPFVCDIQDLWPDTLAATGMLKSKAILGAVGFVCNWVYRRAAALTVLSNGFRRTLIGRGVPAQKLHVIYNWADESEPAPPEEVRIPEQFDGRFNVLFAGTMGKAQALESVLEAARITGKRNPRIQFVFLGSGVESERLKDLAAAAPDMPVLFLPRVPMRVASRILGASDALLVHLRSDPLFEVTVPSKTQAYLAAGRPIIMAVGGDAASIIKAADGGVDAIPEDPESIAEAALTLAAKSSEELARIGAAGRNYYLRVMSLNAGISRFDEVFRSVSAVRP